MASPSRSAWNSIQSLPTPYSDIEDYNSDTDIEDDGTDISIVSSLTSVPDLWLPAQHRTAPPPNDGSSSPKEFKLSTSLHFMKGFNLRRHATPATDSIALTPPVAKLDVPPNHSPADSFGNDQTPTPSPSKCACSLDTRAILLRLTAIEEKVEWRQHTIVNLSTGLEQLKKIVNTLDVNIDAQKDSFLALNARLGDLHTLLKEVQNRGQVQEEFCVEIEQTMKLVLSKMAEARDFAWGYGELGAHEGKRIECGGEAILELKKQLFHGLWEIIEGIEKVDGRIHAAIVAIENGETVMNERIERMIEIVEGDEIRGRQLERGWIRKRNGDSRINYEALVRILGNRLDELLREPMFEKTAQLNRMHTNVSSENGSEDEDNFIEDAALTSEEANLESDLESWVEGIHLLNKHIGGLKLIARDLMLFQESADAASPAETWKPTPWNGLGAAERPRRQGNQDTRARSPCKQPALEESNGPCILARGNQISANGFLNQSTCNYDLEINYDLFLENQGLRLENEMLKAKIARTADGVVQWQQLVTHQEKIGEETDWYEHALWPQGDPEEVLESGVRISFCALM